MSYNVSTRDARAGQVGASTDDIVKGLLILGGIALGLMLLKYLLEGEGDED